MVLLKLMLMMVKYNVTMRSPSWITITTETDHRLILNDSDVLAAYACLMMNALKISVIILAEICCGVNGCC